MKSEQKEEAQNLSKTCKNIRHLVPVCALAWACVCACVGGCRWVGVFAPTRRSQTQAQPRARRATLTQRRMARSQPKEGCSNQFQQTLTPQEGKPTPLATRKG